MTKTFYKEFDISDLSTPALTKIMENVILGNWQSKITDLKLVVKGPNDIVISGYASKYTWKIYEERVINHK